jgi:flagellar protein FliS
MKAINAYKKTAVTTADPMSILVALYDGFISHVEAARLAYERGDRATAGERTGKAMAIVNELQACLDDSQEPEFTARLASVYDFVGQELMSAAFDYNGSRLDEVVALMKELRDAWSDASQQLRAGRAAG